MITLIQNRQTNYCIAIPEEPSLVERTVAGELASYVDKVYGVLLPVVSEDKVSSKAFYVGHTEYAKKNGVTGDSVENWHICVCDENVVLTGGLTSKDRGVSYAVYHFLEDIVGIRWWSWFEEYIPRADKLEISKAYKNSGTPYFEYRNIVDTMKPTNYAYVLRNRMNAWSDVTDVTKVAHKDFVARGGIKYIGLPHPSHTVPRMVPIDEHYDAHPEWFGYDAISGTRPKTAQHGTLYCLKNEGLIRFVADKVIENIEKNAALAEEHGIEMPCFFSVSTADAQGHCQCDACNEAHEKSGRAGYNIQFVNAVAALVGEKYPDVLLHTLVYWDYIEPPLDDTVPAKNVLVHYADLKVDLLRDIEAETNKDGLRLFNAWSEACKKNNSTLYLWDYFLQEYPNCMMPYFLKFPKNYRYFYEKGVTGCFIEHEVPPLSDFYTMTEWLLAKVMENPYQDFDALMEDFTSRYYGAASPYVKQYIDLLEKNLSENACRVMVFEQANISNYVSYETIREGMKILAAAEKAVKDDALRLERLHVVMTCFYRTVALRYDDFTKIAKTHGETIAITKKEAAERVISYLEENAHVYTHENYPEHSEGILKHVEQEITYMKRFIANKKPAAKIPEELKQFGEENIYTVFGTEFFGLAGCGMLPDGHAMGEALEFSEELGYDVLKISPEEMTIRRRNTYVSGSKNDALLNPLVFYTEGYHDNVTLELYHEDLYRDEYHLYHVGDVSGVSAHTATMFRLFAYLGYCVGISNLYEVLPSDKYGIYVNLKVSGNGYGGPEEEPSAAYLDAVYIVKK